jgi:hypothetical protein
LRSWHSYGARAACPFHIYIGLILIVQTIVILTLGGARQPHSGV